MDVTIVLMSVGGLLAAGAIGYYLGQRSVVPEVEDQTTMFGTEIVRLRRRAQEAERAAAMIKTNAERKLRKARIQH